MCRTTVMTLPSSDSVHLSVSVSGRPCTSAFMTIANALPSQVAVLFASAPIDSLLIVSLPSVENFAVVVTSPCGPPVCVSVIVRAGSLCTTLRVASTGIWPKLLFVTSTVQSPEKFGLSAAAPKAAIAASASVSMMIFFICLLLCLLCEIIEARRYFHSRVRLILFSGRDRVLDASPAPQRFAQQKLDLPVQAAEIVIR